MLSTLYVIQRNFHATDPIFHSSEPIIDVVVHLFHKHMNNDMKQMNNNINNRFTSVEDRISSVEVSLDYIKSRVDEHSVYDSARISVLKSVSSHYLICNERAVVHYVQFHHGNQVLRGGITVAHAACDSGVPDQNVFDCETHDISIVPTCPPKGF